MINHYSLENRLVFVDFSFILDFFTAKYWVQVIILSKSKQHKCSPNNVIMIEFGKVPIETILLIRLTFTFVLAEYLTQPQLHQQDYLASIQASTHKTTCTRIEEAIQYILLFILLKVC